MKKNGNIPNKNIHNNNSCGKPLPTIKIILEINYHITLVVEVDRPNKEIFEISHETNIVDRIVDITIHDRSQTQQNLFLIPVPKQTQGIDTIPTTDHEIYYNRHRNYSNNKKRSYSNNRNQICPNNRSQNSSYNRSNYQRSNDNYQNRSQKNSRNRNSSNNKRYRNYSQSSHRNNNRYSDSQHRYRSNTPKHKDKSIKYKQMKK